MMKKNKRSNPSTNANQSSATTDNDNPESPNSSSSHGLNSTQQQQSTTSTCSSAKRPAKGLFDQLDDGGNTNNSASSDCGTPCSSPMIKDPYEFKIKTEDNDSDANDVLKKPRLDQKINESKNDENELSDQQQQTGYKQTNPSIMNSNSLSSSKGMSHLNKKNVVKERKKSVGINTNNEYNQPSSNNNNITDEKPCAPGTEIQLTGTVWLETTAGMLVINVTWRGRSYIGSLLDTSQHKFSPPTPNEFRPNGQPNNVNNCNSPAKGFRSKKRYNIPYRIPVTKNRKNGQMKTKLSNPVKRSTNRNVSESSSSVDDASSVDENQDRLKCPIANCGLKFSSMSRMHEHLKEHSIDSKSELSSKNDDDTLVHDDQTPTSKEPVSVSSDKCLTVETDQRVLTSQQTSIPPRSSSVLPTMKTIDVGSEKDRWSRHETRTPSPPRLAKAHSPSPLPLHHNQPTSTPNLNRQNNHSSASNNLTFGQQNSLPYQTSNNTNSSNNGLISHQPYQQLSSNPQNLSTSSSSSVAATAAVDDPMRLFEKFKNHLSHSSSIGKKSPPKLMPEVNVDNCHPSFMSNKLHHHQKAQQQPPPQNPLNLLTNNNNNGRKSPNDNKSLNTLITESLMAAAAGKLNMNSHNRSQSPLHQMNMPSQSNDQLNNKSNNNPQTSSSDLFAAVMSKMLAGVSATTNPNNSSNGMANNLYNSHNQTLTKSSSMPTTVNNNGNNFNLNSLHPTQQHQQHHQLQQLQQQQQNPSPNSHHPLVSSQFDTKSLSSAAYLMNLPGLLSSTSNHQMR